MNSSEYHLYQQIKDKDEDLQQGDILTPTNGIDNLLKSSHPSLFDKKYIAFLVITQTCDLLRRPENNMRCKAEHINIAVVERLEDVFLSFVDRICFRDRVQSKPGLYSARGKARAIELIERICNQNEWAAGVFFLHNDVGVKLPYHSVAMLQANFPVRAEKHYETLIDARSGRLNTPFQCRLGWLVGNLFSRVATVDFPKDEQEELGKYLIDSKKEHLPSWASKRQLEKLKRDLEGKNLNDIEKGQLDLLLSQYDPTKEAIGLATERAIELIKGVIKITEEEEKTVKEVLKKDLRFQLAFDH